jgi:hypothetical protein
VVRGGAIEAPMQAFSSHVELVSVGAGAARCSGNVFKKRSLHFSNTVRAAPEIDKNLFTMGSHAGNV